MTQLEVKIDRYLSDQGYAMMMGMAIIAMAITLFEVRTVGLYTNLNV